VQRGDIYQLRVPEGVGHGRRVRRFGIIVQSDVLLPRSVVLIAPSSTSARPASVRPEVEIRGQTTLVLVEQVGAVDVIRLGRPVGRIPVDVMWNTDESLATVLDLS